MKAIDSDHNNDEYELNALRRGLDAEQHTILERIPTVYTEEKIACAINTIRAFIKEYKFSNNSLAKKIGYSSSVISQVLNGKYEGDTEAALTSILKFCNDYKRQDDNYNKRPDRVDTSVLREIQGLITNTISFSHEEGKIGLLIGDGGHGKTYCLEIWCKDNPTSAYMIVLDESNTKKGIMQMLAEAVGVDYSGTVEAIIKRLVRQLRDRHAVIIVDEASHLNVSCLNMLRQVICVKCKCPLILSGNNHLLKTLACDSGRSGYESLDQFNSRVMRSSNLDELAYDSTDPGTGLYSEQDIRDMFQYDGIMLAKDAVDTLKHICSTPRSGRLRICVDIISALHKVSSIYQTQLITGLDIIRMIYTLRLPCENLPMAVPKPKRQLADQQQAATA